MAVQPKVGPTNDQGAAPSPTEGQPTVSTNKTTLAAGMPGPLDHAIDNGVDDQKVPPAQRR